MFKSVMVAVSMVLGLGTASAEIMYLNELSREDMVYIQRGHSSDQVEMCIIQVIELVDEPYYVETSKDVRIQFDDGSDNVTFHFSNGTSTICAPNGYYIHFKNGHVQFEEFSPIDFNPINIP